VGSIVLVGGFEGFGEEVVCSGWVFAGTWLSEWLESVGVSRFCTGQKLSKHKRLLGQAANAGKM
jgi:hypothetical protein